MARKVKNMPVHEFGIMQDAPEKGRRYDEYEPEKYGCITVDDGDILSVGEKLNEVKCCWHTLDKSGAGLAYCGVTLIPPESFGLLTDIFAGKPAFSELVSLIRKAGSENKFIIHFGI